MRLDENPTEKIAPLEPVHVEPLPARHAPVSTPRFLFSNPASIPVTARFPISPLRLKTSAKRAMRSAPPRPLAHMRPEEMKMETANGDGATKPKKTRTSLRAGQLEYEIPGNMKPGKVTKCTVRIAGTEVSADTIRISDESDHASIQISNEMGVRLLDLAGGADFKITGFSSEKQSIEKGEFSEWQFFVEPLKKKTGNFVLFLVITAYYNGKQKDVATITKSINTKSVSRKRVVFLAADTNDLNIQEEEHIIHKHFASNKRRFEYSKITALNAFDLNQVLLKESPNFLHYAGHGLVEGILLFNEEQELVMASTENLLAIFNAVKEKLNIECIILNSCFSRGQAGVLKQFTKYLIGTTSAIDDSAAIGFSNGFYMNLFEGLSVRKAYNATLSLLQINDKDPKIKEMYNWF